MIYDGHAYCFPPPGRNGGFADPAEFWATLAAIHGPSPATALLASRAIAPQPTPRACTTPISLGASMACETPPSAPETTASSSGRWTARTT